MNREKEINNLCEEGIHKMITLWSGISPAQCYIIYARFSFTFKLSYRLWWSWLNALEVLSNNRLDT